MDDLLTGTRRSFFDRLSSRVGLHDAGAIVLTHVLNDRPELLAAINAIARISLVIAIPYSAKKDVLAELKTQYEVAELSLEEMQDGQTLNAIVRPYLRQRPHCILEIGGYFAPLAESLIQEHGKSIIGFLEDTEAGHRRYAEAMPLDRPVYSVARSTLKRAEDALVGPSCLFSVERLLRGQGLLEQPRQALVLGYGKVGRGAAHALRARGNSVCVYDIDPIQCTVALAEGFRVPSREESIRNSHIIFGCTGKTSLSGADLPTLRSGTVLVSCSSKSIEFDLASLKKNYTHSAVAPHFGRWQRGEQHIYLLANGEPVNFVDGAVIGRRLHSSKGKFWSRSVSCFVLSPMEASRSSMQNSGERSRCSGWKCSAIRSQDHMHDVGCDKT